MPNKIARIVSKFSYDFDLQGGAENAVIPLIGSDLPLNTVVYGGVIDIITTWVGAGSLIGVQVNFWNDLITATAFDDAIWTVGVHPITPVMTAASAIRLTGDRRPTIRITGAAVTAGKFNLYLVTFVSD